MEWKHKMAKTNLTNPNTAVRGTHTCSSGPVVQVPPLEAQGRVRPLSHLQSGDKGLPTAYKPGLYLKSLFIYKDKSVKGKGAQVQRELARLRA